MEELVWRGPAVAVAARWSAGPSQAVGGAPQWSWGLSYPVAQMFGAVSSGRRSTKWPWGPS